MKRRFHHHRAAGTDQFYRAGESCGVAGDVDRDVEARCGDVVGRASNRQSEVLGHLQLAVMFTQHGHGCPGRSDDPADQQRHATIADDRHRGPRSDVDLGENLAGGRCRLHQDRRLVAYGVGDRVEVSRWQ